jgi:hypothetical protein
MARKPEAPGGTGPPKRKMTQAEQSKLFIKTAWELGAGETEEEFERAFDKVVPPKRRTDPDARKGKTRPTS